MNLNSGFLDPPENDDGSNQNGQEPNAPSSENLSESDLSGSEAGEGGQDSNQEAEIYDPEDNEMSKSFSERILTSPTIPDEVYHKLPILLKDCCLQFEHPRERDMFLTGGLTVLSGCIKSVKGTYSQRTVYPNLMSFVIAPPASGKGAFNFAKDLGMPLHISMLDQNKLNSDQYEREKLRAQSSETGSEIEIPSKPDFRVLYIPGNTSSASIIDLLNKCGGSGIIFETEADTLSNSLKQEWGGFSDALRKAFHHEPVTYSRKTRNELIEISSPKLSVALSGTPSQVKALIQSADDGLSSRFNYYVFNGVPKWKDVSPSSKTNLTEYFSQMGEIVKELANFTEKYPTEFHLSKSQWDQLNNLFAKWLREISAFVSEDASSAIKRLGLITFRIAMIISAIRKFESGIEDTDIICEDEDFETALTLAEVYKEHSILMFCELPKSKEQGVDPNKKRFFLALPSGRTFTRQEALKIGDSLGIKPRTVDKYLQKLLGLYLERPFKNGPYSKIM